MNLLNSVEESKADASKFEQIRNDMSKTDIRSEKAVMMARDRQRWKEMEPVETGLDLTVARVWTGDE